MHLHHHRFNAIPVAVIAGLLVLLIVSMAQAAPAALPPRPTPQPTPIVPLASPTGGLIQLRVSTGSVVFWTAVQWQDAAGGWHTVDGWQGIFDTYTGGVGYKTWWVAPADLGKGPFRWQMSQLVGGQVVATSPAFNLPATIQATTVVTLTVKP